MTSVHLSKKAENYYVTMFDGDNFLIIMILHNLCIAIDGELQDASQPFTQPRGTLSQ